MRDINEKLLQIEEIQELLQRLSREGGTPVAIGGLSSVHKAHIIAAVRQRTGRPVAVLCPDELEAGRLSSDIACLSGEAAQILPPREFNLYGAETASHEWEQQRIPVLSGMASGVVPIVVGAVDAFMQRSLTVQRLRQAAVNLHPGQEYAQETLLRALVDCGYKRCEQVEGVGQFAVRGGIVDFYAVGEQGPVRLEYFGDEIDTLAAMDAATQRRVQPLTSVTLLPCVEDLEDEEFGAAVDLLTRRTIVFIVEQGRTRERIKNAIWRQNQDLEVVLEAGGAVRSFGYDELDFHEKLSQLDVVFLDAFLASSYDLRPHALMSMTVKQLPSFGASFDTAAVDIGHYQSGGYSIAVLCPDARRARHLEEMLREKGLTKGLRVLPGGLSAGLEYPSIKLAVLTEGAAETGFARTRRKSAPKKDTKRRIASYTDLNPGDLVVHDHHGVGRFVGIVKMTVDGVEWDYIKIAYHGADVLYVPVTQLHLVSKYIGTGSSADSDSGESKPFKLSKLGGQDWQKAKSRAKAAAKELAAGLIQLYAERRRQEGFAFPPDDDWQASFEEAFIYDETDDQLRCTAEIKADMQVSCPMDRLLCGDVGFGKTEVALRAVMKCVMGGKQAAILVPTTVLAQQHFETALRRFSRYPVRVEVMNRFRPTAALNETVRHIRMGTVDLVIGTHKLLQKNIKFKNLGLLIVDEEQRFGVTHKERLKEMARQVDVLTLTATPIPRTLNMALSGIRDMSTIEEAPRDRYPVQTFVLEHNWSIVADAIRREVSRGGQVYYLHNRVETIDRCAAKLHSLLPDVSVATAHGQMKEEELSDVMRQMSDGELQVLVCTTIIETGIDIPNVNTLVVEDADRLGLAQLHQLRGRVGRSPRHAFAYLTYKAGKILTEVASKRLTAIREFAEFGSGFKIAMRDLEIRGAGNVLGSEQSGHMVSVGYDMYLRLLEEAVLEERGESASNTVDCTADLTVTAGIPESYIKNPGIRLDIYRRMAAIQDEEEAADMLDELIDRFGDVPAQVEMLTRIALLRAKAGQNGITELQQKGNRLHLKFKKPDFARISALCARPEFKGRLLFSAGDVPYLSCKLLSGEQVLDTARSLVEAY